MSVSLHYFSYSDPDGYLFGTVVGLKKEEVKILK